MTDRLAFPVIGVEGLIATGKTTFTRELSEALQRMGYQAKLFEEPVPENGGNPYLPLFYADQHPLLGKLKQETHNQVGEDAINLYNYLTFNYGKVRYGFTMQIELLGCRFDMQLHAQEHSKRTGPSVLDRTYQGDTCFIKMLWKQGHITDMELKTYMRIYRSMTQFVKLPTICVRLMCSPEIANKRLIERKSRLEGRKCEEGIDLQYLRDLDKEIGELADVFRDRGTKVFEVAWDQNRGTEEDRQEAVEALANRIMDYKPSDEFLELHGRIC